MQAAISFADRIDASLENMSPAEQRVARFFQENREQVLVASAASLAVQAGISDATVIRATKTLGFAGMDELRRTLAAELKEDLSPAGRLSRTLGEVGDDQEAAFDVTLKIHQKALADLRRDISTKHFRSAVQHIVDAQRVSIFGIGPSSAMADYFAIQLRRFGIDAFSLTQTGLLLADGLQRLRAGDLLVTFAYSRVYRELAALLDQADRTGVACILVTDTLGGILGRRVDLVLKVARGRADMLSMHTATLGLIEALLVGIATLRPKETLLGLGQLNRLRTELVGKSMTLPTSPADA